MKKLLRHVFSGVSFRLRCCGWRKYQIRWVSEKATYADVRALADEIEAAVPTRAALTIECIHEMREQLPGERVLRGRASYDFAGYRGTLHMAADSCCDMVDCVRFFARIDPQVQLIETIAGEKPDTSYHRLHDGRWRARDPFGRWWDACDIEAPDARAPT
jgi:hypothetical protein